MTKCEGFTLLETLIVLILITLMFTFGTIKLNDVKAASDERNFWHQMELSWQRSQTRAQNEGKPTWIKESEDGKHIHFLAYAQNSKDDNYDISIPKTIQVIHFAPILMKPNGYVKPTTQEFKSTRTDKIYKMVIQMAWGGYYVEEK